MKTKKSRQISVTGCVGILMFLRRSTNDLKTVVSSGENILAYYLFLSVIHDR